MLQELVPIIAIVVLFVLVLRQQGRLALLEREIGALREMLLPREPLGGRETASVAGRRVVPVVAGAAKAPAEPEATAVQGPEAGAAAAGPWSPPAPSAPASEAASPRQRGRPDIETALGTRWAVWVGGIALALGGLFLVRYSIEAGMFGPGVRLGMAALFGLVLAAGGEFIRRTGFRVPIEGLTGAYVPGILTAAGSFTLFGTVYAAHGVYGFIGPGLAFALLGAIGIGTIALALAHGQALAGIGLLGSMATPIFVSSQSPSAWALFGYLAIVLVANTAIARLRGWVLVAAGGFAGVGLWQVLYLIPGQPVDLAVVTFIDMAMLAALTLLWLRGRPGDVLPGSATDWPSTAAAVFMSAAAMRLLLGPDLQPAGGATCGAAIIVAMLLVALYRRPAAPLLHAAGAATVLVYAGAASSGTVLLGVPGGEVILDSEPVFAAAATLRPAGTVLALAFLMAGLRHGSRIVATAPLHAAAWVGWGALVPLVVLFSLWVLFGNLDIDIFHALLALLLAAILIAAAERVALNERTPRAGGPAVSLGLAGAGIASMLMLHMAFGSLWTTVLAGAAAAVPALATRLRRYPVLGWLALGAALVVACRVSLDPTIVGADRLGRTPVFNALLPGYGIPALAFGFAAWQLARTTDGRPRLAMEASAALFSLLALAMLVRHAMHGGVIDDALPTLAEQAIYTLLAIGAGAILVAIDTRSPSAVLRIGSLAAGVLSTAFVVGQHFVFLNPLLTDEATGRVPVFNLLFLAYLLPALAAGALALYARGKRPQWYSAMLGLLGSALFFAYATLSVRRLFQGEHLAHWAGMGQFETWSYSALWLGMGVGLLVAGLRIRSQVVRVASAVLIAVAVAKVFIFDMSELEGVLRALSFIGLGAVLIGIGLFYQRLLGRDVRADAMPAPPASA